MRFSFGEMQKKHISFGRDVVGGASFRIVIATRRKYQNIKDFRRAVVPLDEGWKWSGNQTLSQSNAEEIEGFKNRGKNAFEATNNIAKHGPALSIK